MSSVTRFIRQIPVSTTYYDAAAVVADASTGGANTMVFEFVPDAGNYVGNYPPGFMQQASAALQAAITAAGASAPAHGALVLRDMGKTIKARYPLTSSTDIGFFRQVQLLNPTALTVAQGSIGGLSGSTFGVLGAAAPNPDLYTNYLTFYIPVTVAGVRGPVVNTAAYAIAGGQM